MGSATITGNLGEGLYTIRLNYDKAALEAERDRLRVEINAAWREINLAFEHLDAMRQDQHRAYHTLHALVEQWKAALLDIGQPLPPVVPEEADADGNNPDTGQPYTEEEREEALSDELRVKVNAERAARGLPPLGLAQPLHLQVRNRLNNWGGTPLSLVPDLTATDYLELLHRQARIDREGRDVHDRLLENTKGLILRDAFEAAASGQTSTDAVIRAWKADPATWAALMDGDVTQSSFGHRHANQFPATYMWAAITAELRDANPRTAEFYATPAGQAVKNAVRAQAGDAVADGLDTGEPGGPGGGGMGGGTTSGRWKADTEYGIGATIEGTYRDSDWGFFAQSIGRYGYSGDTEPLWPAPGFSVGDNELAWMVMGNLLPEENLPAERFWLGEDDEDELTLQVAACTHNHFAEALCGIELAVADTDHGHAAEGTLALIQAHELTVADTDHGHIAEGTLALIQAHELTVADTDHGHIAEGTLALIQAHELTVADTDHGHIAEGNLALIQAHELAVANTDHGHAAEGTLALIQAHELAVANTDHGHAADSVPFA